MKQEIKEEKQQLILQIYKNKENTTKMPKYQKKKKKKRERELKDTKLDMKLAEVNS